MMRNVPKRHLMSNIGWASGIVFALCLFAIGAEQKEAPSKPQYERLLQGADAERAAELNTRIDLATQFGQYDKSVEYTEELLSLRTKVQGADHWETVAERWELDARRKLSALRPEMRAGWRTAFQGSMQASQLDANRQFVKAAPLWQEYHRWCVQIFGEQHSETAISYNKLASNLFMQGKYSDAQPVLQKCLDIRRELFGEAHPLTATDLNNFAYNLMSQGKYADALPILKTALDVRREVLGEKHLATALSYNNLGEILHHQGSYGDAQQLYQKALDLRREMLGEKHADTAISYNNLALSLVSQANYAEAHPHLLTALDLRRKLFGEKHPQTAVSYSSLASNFDALGRYADAQPLHQKCLDIEIELLGETHPDLATSYNNLAVNLQKQGKYAYALPIAQKSLNLRRKLLGEKHPDTAQAYGALAAVLGEQGKDADAQPFFERALALRLELVGEKNPGTANSYNNLAVNLGNQRRNADAQELLLKAHEILVDLMGEKHPHIARSYNNQATNLSAQGKFGDAQLLIQRALAMRLELFGERHPDTAASYNSLAGNLRSMNRDSEAQTYYRKALEIRRELLGEKHPDTALSYFNLAGSLNAEGKFDDAVVLLTRASESYEAARLNVSERGLERAHFGADRSPYRLLAATHAERHSAGAAWVAAEADLARGISDEIAFRTGEALTADEWNEQRILTSNLRQVQQRILKIVSNRVSAEPETDELAALQAKRTALESKFAELVAAVSQREVAGLPQVQSAIPIGAALIMWVDVPLIGADEHWGCIVHHMGEPVWERLPGTGAAGKWTDDDYALPERLRAALSHSTHAADVGVLSLKLYAQRIAPLAKHLAGINTLYVAGVNEMAGVPVEALTREFTISYVPSSTFLARLREREPAGENGLLALGDPVLTRPDVRANPKSSGELPAGGLLITGMARDGAAAKAQLQSGDVLVKYAETELTSVDQLQAAIQAQAAAKEIPIIIWREGEQQPLKRNVPPGRLGVAVSNEPAREAIASRRQTDSLLASLRGGGWTDLPGTRLELSQLARLFGDQTNALVDSAASEQTLDKLRQTGELANYRYLHFATHGVANQVRAFDSVLILAQDAIPADPLPRAGEPFINGQLSAREVLEFWKLNSELVTLSACETALGRKGGGDGLLGFAQAFLTAGSRAVCLSLWKVDDTATALLMPRFYQNLLGKRDGLDKPLPKAKALDEAKRWLRELSSDETDKLTAEIKKGVDRPKRGKGEVVNPVAPPPKKNEPITKDAKPYADPRFWAAFILIGDPN